jgi:hypothetical protein
VPWQIVHGRSGFLVHWAVALAYAPVYGFQLMGGGPSPSFGAATAVVVAILCFLIGGWRQGKALRIGFLAALTGLVFGAIPVVSDAVVSWAVRHFGSGPTPGWWSVIGVAIAIYAGTLTFGTFLMLLTILGLEQHQAFGALAHPGYKHFVRLRVRRDGSAIDGWVLGKVDPLRKNEKIVLVDRFRWKNPRHPGATG